MSVFFFQLYNLLCEYKNMSTAVLFELFIIGEQVRDSANNNLYSYLILKTLE